MAKQRAHGGLSTRGACSQSLASCRVKQYFLKNLDTEEQKAIVVDKRLDSYAGFLQSDFATRVFDAADRATQVKHFALHLT